MHQHTFALLRLAGQRELLQKLAQRLVQCVVDKLEVLQVLVGHRATEVVARERDGTGRVFASAPATGMRPTNQPTNTHFLLKCRDTSLFLNPSRPYSRFASRTADGISTAFGE